MGLENSLASWAKAPGQTELEKCNNAVSAVRKAIAANDKLSKLDIDVFAQGSYCNRTNVRDDSDVDVCVRCNNTWFFDLPIGVAPADCGFATPGPFSYSSYKNEVEAALRNHFKQGHVNRGKKAFDIKENSYRIAADVIPCFEYRRYKSGDCIVPLKGTAFIPDGSAQRIINWPDQNYDNGVAKNRDTGGRFKDVVRILKRLRNKMDADGIPAAAPIPSFLIECLVWNAPNTALGHEFYTADVRETLVYLFNDTIKSETCSE